MSAHFSSPEEKKERKSKAYSASIKTAIILAILTVAEYFVSQIPGIGQNTFVMLGLFGLAKAYLVVYNFMHVARLWLPDGEH